jgi:hypothetical protein
MGSPKRTIWQLQAAKVKRWCCKIANRLGWAWRRSLLLAAACSQATVLQIIKNHFFVLRIMK